MTGSSRHLQRNAGLLRQSEGTSNAHEAEAFLARAQELATLPSIDLALARAADTGPRRATPTMRQITLRERGMRGLSTYVELFSAIARANDVRLDVAVDSTWVIAYRMEPDLAAVELFYACLLPQMITASTAYLRSDEHRHPEGRRVAGLTARLAFQRAFAARVGTRLPAIRDDARTQAGSAETSAGSPSAQLALRGKHLEVADFYTTHSTARGTWRPSRRASRRGGLHCREHCRSASASHRAAVPARDSSAAARMTARDGQRARVYAAETIVRGLFDYAARTGGQVEVFGSRVTVPGERKVVALESIQTYLDTVVALPSARARYPRARLPVTVRHRRGSTAAHYEAATATIAVPLNNRSLLRELIFLHELAHHLQPPSSPGHGPTFTAILCHLVEVALGAEAPWLMRACLTDAGARLA